MTSIKNGNSVTKLRKTMIYDTNIDLVNDNVYTKFGLNRSISFQDIEQKLNSDDDPRGVANLDPRGMIGRIYVEYHLTLLHTKYTSFRPCGFREKDFLMFSHYKPMADNDGPHGRGQFGPQGHYWQEL